MDKNISIEIRPAANGFLVCHPYEGTNRVYCSAADFLVFQSMAELLAHVADHFSHRSGPITPDEDNMASLFSEPAK